MSENRRIYGQPPGRSTGYRLSLGAVLAVALVAACSDGEERPGVLDGPAAVIVGANDYDLNEPLSGSLNVNGAIWTWPVPFNVGTGQINPFLGIQAAPQEEGFNTDGDFLYDQTRSNFTNPLPLNHVPTIKVGNAFFREFILDANEANSGTDALFSITRFDVYVCDDPDAPLFESVTEFASNADCIRIYDLAGRVARATDEVTSGSGLDLDYQILIPEGLFQNALDDLGVAGSCPYAGVDAAACGVFLIFHLDMGDPSGTWVTGSTFEEMSTIPRPYVTVTKDAVPTFTREYEWDILKCVDGDCDDPVTVNLFPGQTHEAEYEVQVDQTGFTDSDWAVTGEITITNPSDDPIGIAGVSDLIEGGIVADVDCPVTFPYALQDGDELVCTYSADLPNANQRTNTATVDLVDLGTNTATAEITFTAPTTEVNKTVDITDSNLLDALAEDLADDEIFEYTLEFTCDADEGLHTNTAYVVGDGDIVLDSDPADIQINCGVLEVSKDATPTFTRTYEWTIDKSVTPATWNLFTGDAGTSEYTVTLDKTGFTDSDWAVTGTITVHNPESFAATVTGVTDEISGVGAATVVCPGDPGPYVIPAGGDLVCTYSSDLPDGEDRTNEATATTSGGGSFSGQADIAFGDPTTEVNATITVDDTYAGDLGEFSDDGSTSYTREFTCDDDEGDHDNTATINETGQSDDASVTVNCYSVMVTKDAATELTRTWTWQLNKEVDTSFFIEETYDDQTSTATIQDGEILDVTFKITGTPTPADSDWKVSGEITVTNPNPSLVATINDVTDIVSPAIAGTVECGVTFPTTVENGTPLVCTYEALLPDPDPRTNTATATLQNHSYDKAGVGTPTGTTDFTGTANVSFADPLITEVDKCIDLEDVLTNLNDAGFEDAQLPNPSQLCADDTPPLEAFVTFSFGPELIPIVCGPNEFLNTVTGTTVDLGIEVDAEAPVNILVECEEGCTLTQGYWMTHTQSHRDAHNGKGPPIDPRWAFIGDADGDLTAELEKETFFLSGQTYYQVMAAPVAGNQYYNLAGQYIAAVLNSQAASVPANVQAALDAATVLFETYTPAEVAEAKGKNGKDLRDQFTSLAGILGSYNEGFEGVPHCTENTNPGV